MAEALFDQFAFTEILAVQDDEWVTIKKTSGSPFSASEAFAVSSDATTDNLKLTRGDTGAVTTYSGSGANWGPFYHDPFGVGFGWMWTTLLQSGQDTYKGTVYGGSGTSITHEWAWYGRGGSSNACSQKS